MAPWPDEAQVEQDLVVARAMVELFSDEWIAASFAMRGGAALHRLLLAGPLRYSEDIDLVQVVPGPIKPFFDALHERLDPWLGTPAYENREHSVRAMYRFETESVPVRRMRLKIEANTREHFAILGVRSVPFAVGNPWFAGEARVKTFELDELLGTKLRALYQRRKGRDLFDLHESGRGDSVDPRRVVATFREYLSRRGLSVDRATFEANLAAKLGDRDFRADIVPLLAPGVIHDAERAAAWLSAEVLVHLA